MLHVRPAIALRSPASSRCSGGFNTSPSAGTSSRQNGHDQPPQIEPRQSSCCFGDTTARAPIKPDSAVITPRPGSRAALHALGNVCNPSRASEQQLGSNGAAGGSASGQGCCEVSRASPSSMAETGSATTPPAASTRLHSPRPARWYGSLKSVVLVAALLAKLGFMVPARGLGSFARLDHAGDAIGFQSSSAARIRRSAGYLACSA